MNDKNEESNSNFRKTSQKFGMSSGQLSTFRSTRGMMMPKQKNLALGQTIQDQIIEEGSVYSEMTTGTIQPKGFY